MVTDFQNIVFKKKEGLARITLNRPPLNILNIAMMKEVNIALEDVRDDPDVKILIIKGEGKTFSGGVDVKEHTANKYEEMLNAFHQMFRLLISLPQPTLAVVNGSTLGGGCELALFCDLVIASETAKLGQPEIKVGVLPPIAAIIFPRLIGRKKAMELILTGNVISAEEAWRLGLVNQIVPEDKLEETVDNLAQKLLGLSGVVLRLNKRAIYQGLDTDFEEVLQKVENVYLQELMSTKDAIEGLQAFLEKRSPVWQNQ